MSGFSPDWLALREGADHRSRDEALIKRVVDKLPKGEQKILDLGSGTGSNLRASSPFFGKNQNWTLVDYDANLLETAARLLPQWAEKGEKRGETLHLTQTDNELDIAFVKGDLNHILPALLARKPDLVTASALFDLVSSQYIADFARQIVATGAAFYTVLTYDGRDEFTPPHPLDHAVITAFGAHQQGDKGFGAAAGPHATNELTKAFLAAGYKVETAPSPWVLTSQDLTLVQELLKGITHAVAETGRITPQALTEWLDFRLKKAEDIGSLFLTGHTDLLAFPA